jgi:hypothetical protein
VALTSPVQALLLGTLNPDGSYTGVTTGTSVPQDCHGCPQLTVTLESVGPVTAGAVAIEEASRPTYTGPWSQITLAAPAVGAGQAIFHLTPACYAYLRLRITNAMTGGTLVAFLDKQGT